MDLGDLSRQKVFKETWWLYYCCCAGEGCGNLSPLVLGDVKELCIHTQMGTTDCTGDQGLCAQIETMLCFTTQFALPPAKDTYTCVCCNMNKKNPREKGTELKSEIFTMSEVMEKPFWLIYCCCGGTGVNMPSNAPGGYCCATQAKMLCCAQAQMCEDPVTKDRNGNSIYCSELASFLCLWAECQLPPAAGGPVIACCNMKKNSDHSAADAEPPEKPKMKEMVVA